MKASLMNSMCVLSILSMSPFASAEARQTRLIADSSSQEKNERDEQLDVDEDTDAETKKSKSKRKANVRQAPQQKPSNTGYWYMRVQQLPLLGMAAVSDTGVADVEFMKVINPNFHIGPTVVYHFGKMQDTKMQSFNLGVRADLILNEFGNVGDVYVSSAFMLGAFQSKTKSVLPSWDEQPERITCDFTSKGFHRVGAFVAGKLWTLSDTLHVTTGLGVVKSKISGKDTQSGFCEDKAVRESDGVTLPWFDLGVGFKI